MQFLHGSFFMQHTSPRSSSRELIVAKLEALLDECDLVADHAPLAETFDILVLQRNAQVHLHRQIQRRSMHLRAIRFRFVRR